MRPSKSRRPSSRLGQRVHGDLSGARGGLWRAVWTLVRRIPRGRVMTYGQIAGLLSHRLSPRAVGWALHGCPSNVPWQRVVNATGGCSTARRPDLPDGLQRALLEAEGISFREDGTLDLERYRWAPRKPAAAGGGPGRARSRPARAGLTRTRTGRGRSVACRP